MQRANRPATLLVVVLSVTLAFAGCTSSRHKGKGRVYDEKNGFSIVPPTGWNSKGEFAGSFMIYVGPREGDFTVNLNVNLNEHDGTPIEQAGSQVKPMFERA